jgi:hypothetical protein
LERQLQSIEGLLPKVKPPTDQLPSLAETELAGLIKRRVRVEVERQLRLDVIVEQAIQQIGLPLTFNAGGLSGSIDEQLQRKPEQSWKVALQWTVEYRLNQVLDADRIASVVQAAIRAEPQM